MATIARMAGQGIRPIQMKTRILEDRDEARPLVSKDIYNVKAKMRKQFLQGRTPIQALLDNLATGDFHHRHRTNQAGEITGLFWTHPKSLELLATFHHTLILDCTYKTNRYSMPLLHLVGFSSTKKSFSAGFCFMARETEQYYNWALGMLKDMLNERGIQHPKVMVTDRDLALMSSISAIFPESDHILCTWHINKDVLANFKKLEPFLAGWDFQRAHEGWNSLVYMSTEKKFHDGWADYCRNQPTQVISYLESTWVPLREKFIMAWTKQVAHLGNGTSSRAEGAHSTIKGFIYRSTGTLLEVVQDLSRAMTHQHSEIIQSIATARDRPPMFLPKCVHHLRGQVAPHALLKVHELARQKDVGKEKCTETTIISTGIPCVHMVKGAIKREEEFGLEDFHPQWHLV